MSSSKTLDRSGAEDGPASKISPVLRSEDENMTIQDEEDSLKTIIERLGKERPPAFHTSWSEVSFVFSIIMSQLLTEYFVSGFTVILPTLIRDLDIPQAASVWPATAFSLVIASTLLVFGRFGDMWGGYPVFLGGLAWLLVWSVIAGFSINPMMLDFCRALQGLGASAILPSGVMLMGSIYRPGPRKNLVFAIYGTAGVLGFWVGISIAGIVGQFLRWGFYFWIGAVLAAVTLATSIVSVPKDTARRQKVQMDWYGAVTIITGLVLVVFAITESAHTENGWRTPYIPILFVVGCLSLLLAVYVEGWVAESPLLPGDIFAIPSMIALTVAILILYGTWGIFSVYGTQYFQNIMGASPIQIVAWYAPLGGTGLIFSIIEGYILHLVPGRILLIISGLGALGSQLLIALIPEGGGYWAWIFPATILSTIGIDVSTILMTVFVTTRLPASRQGLAGGLINSVLQLGVALVLGFADIIQSYTVDEVGLAKSYKNTFWFGVALGGASLILMAVWGDVPRAQSELTADERTTLLREARGEAVD